MEKKRRGPGAPPGFRIRTPHDVRRVLARIMNEVYREEITPDVAAKIGYLAGMWLKAYEQADLLDRVKKLEETISFEREGVGQWPRQEVVSARA